MHPMQRRLAAVAAAFLCAGAASTMAMTKEEHKAENDRIESSYKAARERCNSLKDNAKDVCISEAKGAEKVAKAELETKYKPSPRADAKLKEARAEAAYDVAKEKCDDLAGNAKDTCQKDAKAARDTARADAKVSSRAADGGTRM